MKETLGRALKALFGTAPPAPREVSASVRRGELEQARKELEKAEKAVEQGSWEGFGKAMEALKRLLSQPSERAK